MEGSKVMRFQNVVKRTIDIVCSGLGLIVLSPILLITAVLIRIKLGSPIFFTQDRLGKDGKIFKMIKFRTMLDAVDKWGELYSKEQWRRHEVRPGITGWAQVNGRNNISWCKKFELDIWYIDNKSLLMDMKILIMTVLKVIKRADINQDGEVTVEDFNGYN